MSAITLSPAAAAAPAEAAPWRRALRRLVKRRGAMVGAVVVLFFVAVAIFAPLISPYDPIATNWLLVRKPPSLAHWFGTDEIGRDVLARIIYGTRISLLFGLTLTFFSSIIGVGAGAIQGYFGGWTDIIFQRVIEIWSSVPSLYLLIIISSVLVPGFWVLLGILMLFTWTSLVQLVRAEFLRARNFEYVRAARALGLSNATIMWKHLLPNATVATLTMIPFILNGAISALTALDYLSLGLPPGTASLGELLQQGQSHPEAYWLSITGFFVTAVLLSLLIFIGEAVRDALDPRKTFN